MKPLLLSLTSVVFCGCMHTEIGGNPDPSPDNQYAIVTRAFGASGKAYVVRTKKRFAVWLGPTRSSGNSVRPLKKEYAFVAGDLTWKVNWLSAGEVAIHLFDYGDAVSAIDAHKAGAPSNHVASLIFRKIANGQFVQAASSKALSPKDPNR